MWCIMAEPYKSPPSHWDVALPCSLWNIATKQENPKHQVAGGKNKINGHDRELDKIHERQKRGAISISIYIQGLKWTGMIENWDLHQQFFARLLLLLAAPPITCLHLPPWKCTRQLTVENSSQGWIHQPASSLPTDHLLDSILQQYK